MTSLALPSELAAYFAADQQNDSSAVANCFLPDGVVVDEARSHIGRVAIAMWKADASARYRYQCVPLQLETTGDRHVVTGRLTGNFPGSPIDLRYSFVLSGAAIARLEIAA